MSSSNPGVQWHAVCQGGEHGAEVHYFTNGDKCQCGKRTKEPPSPDLRVIEGGNEPDVR